MNIELNKNQILTWQQAYIWQKLEIPKYITGFNLKTKATKEFMNPFLKAGYIHKDTLKFTGVFRLTKKGTEKFEELLETL